MKRAMILPLVFGVLFILLITGYGFVFFLVPIPLVIKIIIALVILTIAAAMVYLLVQRNREIKEEEKIDLSKDLHCECFSKETKKRVLPIKIVMQTTLRGTIHMLLTAFLSFSMNPMLVSSQQ